MSDERHYLDRELEERIQTDPEVWRFLREGSLDGVWYWDLENPEHEYMSPEFWKLFGFDPATKAHLVAEWQDLIHADDLKIAQTNVGAHIADPAHPYDQIVRYTCADGSTAWVRCRGIAIRDETGKAIRLLGAHNDITAQKRAEESALGVSKFLEQIMETSHSGIVALNPKGQIVSINSAARHFLAGLTAPVPCDWPSDIRFAVPDTEDGEKTADPIQRAVAGETLAGVIYTMTTGEDGHVRFLRISSAPGSEDIADLGCVLILDDVTEQESNRQQIERKGRLDALGQLTGGIAHDFNNLLATVNYAVVLAERESDPELRGEYLKTARESVEKGAALTSRLLAFAKQQPGLARSLRVGPVVDEFRSLAGPLIEAAVALNFRVSSQDLLVFCDNAQLQNALLNLVLNARDAILRSGEHGEITVSVRKIDELDKDAMLLGEAEHTYNASDLKAEHRQNREDDVAAAYRYVEFSVADNGPGMSERVKSRAIDPFFTTKDNNSGTGLGLSMVYGFVQQSGGQLRLYSEPGQGTTVRLLLPRGTEYGEREAPMPRKDQPMGNGQHILIIEDEYALASMMSALLRSLGYAPETVSTGRDALRRLDTNADVDLVLTDIILPGGMSGFALAAEIRAKLPEIPLLYMSGYTGYTDEDMGDVVAPMLQKPCPLDELATAIAEVLEAAGK